MAPAARATVAESLGREDWEDAALQAIEEGGLGAVAVEPIARRLGVTKGSFYWHFATRDALVAAALERWERLHTTERLAELGAVPDPAARLRALFDHAASLRPTITVALLAAADDDLVAPVVRRATASRIAFLTATYRELGFPPMAARQQAMLAYSAYLGLAHLQRDAPELLGSARATNAYVRHVAATLIPADGRNS